MPRRPTANPISTVTPQITDLYGQWAQQAAAARERALAAGPAALRESLGRIAAQRIQVAQMIAAMKARGGEAIGQGLSQAGRGIGAGIAGRSEARDRARENQLRVESEMTRQTASETAAMDRTQADIASREKEGALNRAIKPDKGPHELSDLDAMLQLHLTKALEVIKDPNKDEAARRAAIREYEKSTDALVPQLNEAQYDSMYNARMALGGSKPPYPSWDPNSTRQTAPQSTGAATVRSAPADPLQPWPGIPSGANQGSAAPGAPGPAPTYSPRSLAGDIKRQFTQNDLGAIREADQYYGARPGPWYDYLAGTNTPPATQNRAVTRSGEGVSGFQVPTNAELLTATRNPPPESGNWLEQLVDRGAGPAPTSLPPARGLAGSIAQAPRWSPNLSALAVPGLGGDNMVLYGYNPFTHQPIYGPRLR